MIPLRDPQAEFDRLDALSRKRELNLQESLLLERAIRQIDEAKARRRAL